jgi:lysophospholipase L1-like esterase
MKRLLLGALAFVSVVCVTGLIGTTAQASSPTVYYLALGDSLSTGGGATSGAGYVNDIFAWASRKIAGLQLEDLGCGGDTTTRMIHGGLCHNYVTGDQLGDAEAFLKAHPGAVAFVTIDVGGDDIDGCGISGTINPTCVKNALATIGANLPIILSGLKAAAGSDVPIVGMNYYDPYLAAWYSGAWFNGAPSEALAQASLPVLHSLNKVLSRSYKDAGVTVANVQRPFRSNDWHMTGSFSGETLPQNVANICNWTNMCLTGGGDPNIHTNDYGHSLIAAAYEKVMTFSGAGNRR